MIGSGYRRNFNQGRRIKVRILISQLTYTYSSVGSEQLFYKQQVPGSNPGGCTNLSRYAEKSITGT